MARPFLAYPVKQPINQSNLFGANPPEYRPLGQNGHPGNDFECPLGTKVYAPCDGNAFYAYDSLGGDGIYIRAENNTFNVILWHMVPPGTPNYPYAIPITQFATTPVKAGQFLGYSGNSGFPRESTGPHLHLGLMPINSQEVALNPNNGFMGCIDPAPFYTGEFAEDIGKVQVASAVVAQASEIVAQVATAPISTAEKLSLLDQLKQLLSAISVLFQRSQ